MNLTDGEYHATLDGVDHWYRVAGAAHHTTPLVIVHGGPGGNVYNFERTIGMLKGDQDQKVKNLVIGLEMIEKQFVDTLGKHGMTPIQSIGKEFDPNFHEAMAQEYAEGKKPNQVIKEFQRGFSLNGRVIRASKVVVASDKQ